MPKKIATKASWVKLGFDLFCEGGTEALKIEAMARTLGVSKASFYHFFKNRDVFLVDIVGHWHVLRTEEFIELSKAKSGKASMIENLILAIFSANIKDDFVFYLRRLGTTKKTFGDMLRDVEMQRVGFAAQAIEELGFSAKLAEQKAVIIYNYYLGWRERQGSVLEGEINPNNELALLVDQLGLVKQTNNRHDRKDID